MKCYSWFYLFFYALNAVLQGISDGLSRGKKPEEMMKLVCPHFPTRTNYSFTNLAYTSSFLLFIVLNSLTLIFIHWFHIGGRALEIAYEASSGIRSC